MDNELFGKLEPKLTGEDKKLLLTIKEQYIEITELWKADIEVLEKYYEDQEKQNEELILEVTHSNDQIKKLQDQVLNLNGIVDNNNKLGRAIKRNDERIARLKGNGKTLRRDHEKIKKSYAAQLGWEKKWHKDELKGTIKSYAAQLGWSRKWYQETIETLEKIYMLSDNNKFKNLDTFKSKIKEMGSKEMGSGKGNEGNGVKSALDSYGIKCYKLSHGTSTQNRVFWCLVPCADKGTPFRF